MKLMLLLPIILLSACTTVVPVTSKWPSAPGTLVQQPCPELQKLADGAKLSDVATVVTLNYSEYYQCAVKLEAWQRWYAEQQVIYKGLK